MFKKITTATILVSSLFVASSVQAVEVSVEQLVGSLITQAVEVTKEEISYGVEEAILTANNSISLDSGASEYVANITITDLDSNFEIQKEENEKAE
ncbi:hypothetical protein [Aliiglaciecola lipolytica]|uniref:Uncharacterized protein n=1 Tax=Aliiglaciecola lipolytica E3 TaxID=1127673 RepID=K6YCM9_9ALTE|nr:hypothetical protein [Aliiglaciecola lipolytica]GAC15947.1 hypothetical protein GLIP_3333 [Aliiglaciecola lipolytica E3]